MKLKVIAATVFKQSPQQSSELADHEKLSVAAGREFAIAHQAPTEANHLQVTLVEPLSDRTVWYVFAPHVRLENTPMADTVPASTEDKATNEATSESGNETTNNPEEEDLIGAIGCSTVIAILGLLCLIVPVVQAVSPPNEGRAGLNAIGWTGLLAGVSMTAFGAWYGADSVIRSRKNQKEKLKDTFYALLEEQSGEITLLQFAKAADISGSEARAYLDQMAKEFNATFEVDMNGGITYHFR